MIDPQDPSHPSDPSAEAFDLEAEMQEPVRRPSRPSEPPRRLGAELPQLVDRLRTLASGDAAARRRAEHAERLARQRVQRLERLAGELCLPPDDDLRDVALEDRPPPTEALVAFGALVGRVLTAERRRPELLVVGGPPGTGKTAAMSWALLRLAFEHQQRQGNDRAALFVTASEVATTPRGGWGESFLAWQRWLHLPVLGIDDVGTELVNPELLLELLTERYNRTLVTLVTTNLNRKAFGERYPSARLADRLTVGIEQRGQPTGVPWYVVARGASLRDLAAREQLRTSHEQGGR